MKLLNKYISFLLLILSVFVTSSCDNREDGTTEFLPSSEGKLTFFISPMSEGDLSKGIEWIKTLRIIITDADGRVKENWVSGEYSYQDPENFSQELDFYSSKGVYHVYAIANEESIEDFEVEDRTLNIDKENKTFTDLLNGFNVGQPGFEDFIRSVYYAPDYSNLLVMISDYEVKIEEEVSECELYLVNNATKFEINFINYRNDDVTFNSIKLQNIADVNYLMADIAEGDQKVNDQYWINWLHDVAEDTSNHPGIDDSQDSNDLVNERWGWLPNYGMPEDVEYAAADFIKEGETWVIQKATTQSGTLPIPYEESKGPFYFPESNYIPEGKTKQQYSLKFEIQTSTGDPKIITKDLVNIKTLFRHTHAIIDVEMASGEEEIYVEIYPWYFKDPVYGTISPE